MGMKQIFFVILSVIVFMSPVAAQVLGEPMESYIREQEAVMDRYFETGDYQNAEAVLRPLIAKATEAAGPAHIKVLRMRQALANVIRLQGRYNDALREMQDAYDIWEKNYLKFNPYRMDAAMQLAVHLSKTGNANDALPLALEATKFAESVWGGANEQTMLWQYNTAGIFKELGYWDEALRIFDGVLPRLDAANTPKTRHYACSVSQERARLLRDMNRPQEAAQAYEETLKRDAACFPPNHPEIVHALGEYALVLYKVRDFDRMGQIMDQWHDGLMASYGENSLPFAEYLGNRALMKSHGTLGTPAFEDALADMRASVLLREKLLPPDHSFIGKAYMNLGAMENDAGHYGIAWQMALRAEQAGQGSRQLLMDTLLNARESGEIPEDEALSQAFRLVQVNHNSAARAAYEMLAQRVELGDTAKTENMRRFTDMQRRQDQLQRDMSYLAALPSAERRPDTERNIRAEMEQLSAQINTLGDTLSQQDIPFEAMYQTKPLSLADAQAMLSPQEALVIFDIGPEDWDRHYVFVATQDRAEWRELHVSIDNLKAAIRDLRASIDLRMGVRAGIALKKPTGPDRNAYDLYAAHWVYTQTFAPIADMLAGKDHIYTELRGPLSAVPPQLLVRNDVAAQAQADWLVRHHAVTVIPSIQSLKVTTLARQTARAGKPFLGFADPIFGDGTTPPDQQVASLDVTRAAMRGALAPLPETAVEVRAVAQAVGAPVAQSVRQQSTASEADLKHEDLRDYRVLYFATHGLVAGDMVTADQQLAEPALALTAGQGEDGLLTASEIASLRLNADWVVLSACNTAVGDEPGAEALSGLAQAFTYAGARALMVSHWPVESRSAVALMTDLFARRAADPTLSAAKAQQQAILAMIDAPQRAEWSHPAYWAPFILVGNPD
jgi:CHAT domain-containing protein